jgi:hypothetical protein
MCVLKISLGNESALVKRLDYGSVDTLVCVLVDLDPLHR